MPFIIIMPRKSPNHLPPHRPVVGDPLAALVAAGQAEMDRFLAEVDQNDPPAEAAPGRPGGGLVERLRVGVCRLAGRLRL